MFRDTKNVCQFISQSTSTNRASEYNNDFRDADLSLRFQDYFASGFVLFFTFDTRRVEGWCAKLWRERERKSNEAYKGREIQSSVKAFLILKHSPFALLRFSTRCYGLLHTKRLLDFALSVLNSCQLVRRSSLHWCYTVEKIEKEKDVYSFYAIKETLTHEYFRMD